MPKAKAIEYMVNNLIFIYFHLTYEAPIYSEQTKEIRFLFNTLPVKPFTVSCTFSNTSNKPFDFPPTLV